MAILTSAIDASGAEFRANAEAMRALTAQLQACRAEAALGGSEKSRERHVSRGKLLPRDRVMNLIDPGSPFLELSPLAAFGMYDGDIHAAGIITGIGRVAGRECVIVCNDATIKGGTYYPMTVKKHLRAQEIARENRLPCIYLVDSGGANLPNQAEIFPDREHFGRIFYNQATHVAAAHSADRRGDGLVHRGRRLCAGDVRRDHHRQGAGHHLPRRPAAGEGGDRRNREGRGSRRRRCARPPVRRRRSYAHMTTRTRCRSRGASSPVCNHKKTGHSARCAARAALDTAELNGIVPPSLTTQYDVREVIARLVDGSEFDEFKKLYGTTIVTGFAHIEGMPVGIVANNGILFSESALKAAHFIELCCQRRIPLLFLQNISGFMVGQKYEAGGIAKDGAKMVTAVACAQVPKITLIIGGSYGAGNYGMCGRAYWPRFLFTWPNARISVMGGEQAASVLATVKRDARAREDLARRGRSLQGADPRAIRERGQSLLRHRAAVGRRHHRAGRYAPRAGAGILSAASMRRCRRRSSACSGCDASCERGRRCALSYRLLG